MHHGYVGPPLVELQADPIVAGVLADEGKQPEVALRVAGAKLIQAQMPEAQIAVIVLDTLAQQFLAILRLQHIGCSVGMGAIVFLLATRVELEPRIGIVDAAAIGPAVELHLQDP